MGAENILDATGMVTPTYEVKEQINVIEQSMFENTVAILKDDHYIHQFVMLTPTDAQTLIDHKIKVFMQRGFSEHSEYTDMDYANVGVEFEDDIFTLARCSKLLVKYAPINEEDLDFLKDEQILLTNLPTEFISASYIEKLNEKKITSLAINLIEDENGKAIIDKILENAAEGTQPSVEISTFILSTILTLTFSPNLQFSLQKMPSLIQSVCTCSGQLCNRDMADRLNLTCRDILSLCWDLN